MLSNLILPFFLAIAGYFLFKTVVLKMVICVFCFIPLTRIFAPECRHKKVDAVKIYFKIAKEILARAFFAAAALTAAFCFCGLYAGYGALAGIVLPIVFSIRKFGMTDDNASMYFKKFSSFYSPEDLDLLGITSDYF